MLLRELRVVSNSWGKGVSQTTEDRIVVINKTTSFDARVKEVFSHKGDFGFGESYKKG